MSKPKFETKVGVLEIHGTVINRLKPQNLVQAAKADLQRAESNKGCAPGTAHQFAFHRKHVHKCDTALKLIELAIAEQELGLSSGKRNTRMIYRDILTLAEARDTLKTPENQAVNQG